MPNGQTINFGPGQDNTDLQAQQAQLLRKQQLADMLRQQSMATQGTETVSGRAVKQSPWTGAAMLAKALMANKMNSDNDSKQTELGNMAAERSAAALRGLAPAGTFDPPPNNTGMMGLPSETEPPPAATQDPAMRERWAKALAAYRIDPQMGRDMIKNLSEMTNDQKDLLSQGIDPKAYGEGRVNKLKTEGVMSVAPGNTVYSPADNKPVFAAPDFSKGQDNTYGPTGAPRVALMEGSGVIPQQAGAVTDAQEAAKAAHEMVTVNTPQGPQMMTRAQAVQLSAPKPPAPQGIPPTGIPPNVQALLRKADMATDPQQKAALLQQANAMQPQPAGAMPGIALQTPAQAAQQVGAVQNDLAVDRARREAAQSPEQIAKLTDAQGTLGLAKMARDILSEGKATGSLGGQVRDAVTGAVGVSTMASQQAAQLAAIGGALVAKQPKMSGPQSDKDVLLYKEMAGRVGDSRVPIGDRVAALDVIEGLNKKYLVDNQNGLANEALSTNIHGKFNVTTGKIEPYAKNR